MSIDLWQRKSSLDDIEKKVVVVLLDHYNETGSKFFYVLNHYDIAERFGVRPDQVNQVLMNLKEDHIIYTYPDRQHDNATKIGLTKDFIKILEMSAEAGDGAGSVNAEKP